MTNVCTNCADCTDLLCHQLGHVREIIIYNREWQEVHSKSDCIEFIDSNISRAF